MTHAERGIGLTLALPLAASQAALLVLSPILVSLAADLDVSTATAGQLRTISGLAAGVTALSAGLVASRYGLRDLLAVGLLFLVGGSALSAASPDFGVLAAAQILIGVGAGLSYSAAVAAAAEWADPADRSRVLAAALLGPPLAWVVGMPIAGLAGDANWRLAWIAVPLASALLALVVLVRHPSTPPAPRRAGLRTVLAEPGVVGWSVGELLAYSAWVGTLVFALGAIRPNAWASLAIFAALSFIAGGRTLAGSARGLDLAPELRLGVTGVRTGALQFGAFVGAGVGGLALAAGGFEVLGAVFAGLFVCATIPHVISAKACRPVDSSTLVA